MESVVPTRTFCCCARLAIFRGERCTPRTRSLACVCTMLVTEALAGRERTPRATARARALRAANPSVTTPFSATSMDDSSSLETPPGARRLVDPVVARALFTRLLCGVFGVNTSYADDDDDDDNDFPRTPFAAINASSSSTPSTPSNSATLDSSLASSSAVGRRPASLKCPSRDIICDTLAVNASKSFKSNPPSAADKSSSDMDDDSRASAMARVRVALDALHVNPTAAIVAFTDVVDAFPDVRALHTRGSEKSPSKSPFNGDAARATHAPRRAPPFASTAPSAHRR
mmetsp:Transcript_5515/g.12218  ORF Transcript_5515/g.12218 Transcript_5515/m.12218 type:complete len:287 (+) Transcript_5515:1064-1924(+)